MSRFMSHRSPVLKPFFFLQPKSQLTVSLVQTTPTCLILSFQCVQNNQHFRKEPKHLPVQFKLKPLMSFQVDIHLGGKLVESLTEAEPDTPVRDEAPPTSAEDTPDTGDQWHPDDQFPIDTLRSSIHVGFDPQPDYRVLCITVINEGVLWSRFRVIEVVLVFHLDPGWLWKAVTRSCVNVAVLQGVWIKAEFCKSQ